MSAFPGEGVQRRKVDRPGPTLDHFSGLLPMGKLGSQPGNSLFTSWRTSAKSMDRWSSGGCRPGRPETVEIVIGFPQELQHIEQNSLPAGNLPLIKRCRSSVFSLLAARCRIHFCNHNCNAVSSQRW